MPKKAMIFAAGMGTRLGARTMSQPKALVKVHGIPVLELAILKLKSHGFREIIVNVHHFGNQIIDFLRSKKNFDIHIEISNEKDQLLDTGGGLKRASWFFDNSPVLVYNVDVITDLDLDGFYEYHIRKGGLATLAVRNRDTKRYLLFGPDGILYGWKNIQTGEQRISRPGFGSHELAGFSGISIVSPEFLRYLPEEEVFPILDVYLELAKDFHIVCFKHNEGRWLDIGKPGSIEEAERLFPEINT